MMSINKKIKTVSLLLDPELVTLLYEIRIFPEGFKVRSSFWHEVCNAEPQHLIDLLLSAVENTRTYLNGASISEWKKYVANNYSALRLFIDYLSNAPLEIIESAYDEYCKGKKREFTITDDINNCIINSLEIKSGSLYYPCASSEFLLMAANKLSNKNINIFGQLETWSSLKNVKKSAETSNLYLPDTPANVLIHDSFSQLKFDYIVANPPFNSSDWITDYNVYHDSRWIYGIPPKSNANFAWLQHVISHLNETGKAVVILPNSTLSGGTVSEKNIRKEIICSGILSAVITFPRNTFRNTTAAFCIWLLNKSKSDHILFVDITRLKAKENVDLTVNPIEMASTIIQGFNDNLFNLDNSASTIVNIDDISKNNFELNPNLYLKSNYNLIALTDNKSFEISIDKIMKGDFSVELKESLKLLRQSLNTFVCNSLPLLALYDVSVGIMANKKRFGSGTKLLNVKTIINNPFVPDMLNDHVETTDFEKHKYSVQKGDVFLNRGSETLDKLAHCSIALKSHDAVISGWAKRLRPKDNTIYPKYAAAYFCSDFYRKQVIDNTNICTTRFSINDSVLSKINVIFPQYDLQRLIGDVFYELCQSFEACNDELKQFLFDFKTIFLQQAICKPIIKYMKNEEIHT